MKYVLAAATVGSLAVVSLALIRNWRGRAVKKSKEDVKMTTKWLGDKDVEKLVDRFLSLPPMCVHKHECLCLCVYTHKCLHTHILDRQTIFYLYEVELKDVEGTIIGCWTAMG